MGYLGKVIKKESRKEVESYIRWEYEDIAPTLTPQEYRTYKSDLSSVRSSLKTSPVDAVMDPSFTLISSEDVGKYWSDLGYTSMQVKNIKNQVYKSREKLREDLMDGYSSIKINKINGRDEYTNIQLINSDRFQKLSDPTKWAVLVLYTGSGKDNQGVGILVRKNTEVDANLKNTSIDNIGGMV